MRAVMIAVLVAMTAGCHNEQRTVDPRPAQLATVLDSITAGTGSERAPVAAKALLRLCCPYELPATRPDVPFPSACRHIERFLGTAEKAVVEVLLGDWEPECYRSISPAAVAQVLARTWSPESVTSTIDVLAIDKLARYPFTREAGDLVMRTLRSSYGQTSLISVASTLPDDYLAERLVEWLRGPSNATRVRALEVLTRAPHVGHPELDVELARLESDVAIGELVALAARHRTLERARPHARVLQELVDRAAQDWESLLILGRRSVACGSAEVRLALEQRARTGFAGERYIAGVALRDFGVLCASRPPSEATGVEPAR